MGKGITLSPKHGLNPSIGKCFFCGGETGELLLMGKLHKKHEVKTAYGTTDTVVDDNDAEAPKYACASYEPCDRCKEQWSQGVACIGVIEKTPVKDAVPIQKSMGKSLYPTGSVIVMRPEAIKRVFDMDMEAGSITLMDETVLQDIMKSLNDAAKQNEGGEKDDGTAD